MNFCTGRGTAQAIKNGLLWPYLKEIKVYQCRSGWRRGENDLLRSYAIAYTMGGARNENDSRDGIKPFREYGEIDKPSRRMVFADSSTKHYFLYGPFWPIERRDGQLKFKPYDGFNGQYMTTRHSNGANYSFADLHCEYVRCKSRKTIEMIAKGPDLSSRYHESRKQHKSLEDLTEEASQNNPDLDRIIEFLKGRKK